MNRVSFTVFWSVNDDLDADKLKKQMDEFHRLTFDGVIFHPRNYTNRPEYLSREYFAIVSEVILYAKKLGMDFWIYDENGYPSGSASGKVEEQMPELCSEWAELIDGNIVFKKKRSINILNKKACGLFIELTYEGYRRSLAPEAFEYVQGFFSDEVGFLDGCNAAYRYGGVPYSADLAVKYKEKYNRPLSEDFPCLFEEHGNYREIRTAYWETAADLLKSNFYEPIRTWCETYGKRSTGHVKGEENPYFQVGYSGSAYQILSSMSLPGVDALERDPGNCYYPRIAKSVSEQFSDGNALSEAIGGAGWGLCPDDFVRYVKWLMDCGINIFTFHLSQYVLKAQAVRDWPSSIPLHVTWKDAFPAVLNELRDYYQNTVLPEAQKEKVILVCPTRGVMSTFPVREVHVINEHNGAGVPDTSECGRLSNAFMRVTEKLHELGYDYRVTEERIIEECGTFSAEGLTIGRQTYSKAVLPDGCVFRNAQTEQQLKALTFDWEHPVLPEAQTEKRKFTEQEAVQQTEIVLPEENQLLLAYSAGEPYRAAVEIKELLTEDTLLSFTDPAEKVCLNGTALRKQGDLAFRIPENLWRQGNNEITFEAGKEKEPFVFLRGKFTVQSRGGYSPFPKNQLYTAGGFYLRPYHPATDPRNLVQQGFPFCGKPVTLKITFTVPRESCGLRFCHVQAAAVEVSLDGKPSQWLIHEPYELNGISLTRGTHRITAELYPSTFNTYGPHHHIDGDRHVVSPDQFSGKKNFADHPDVPEYTLTDGWHFVCFGAEGKITLLTEK